MHDWKWEKKIFYSHSHKSYTTLLRIRFGQNGKLWSKKNYLSILFPLEMLYFLNQKNMWWSSFIVYTHIQPALSKQQLFADYCCDSDHTIPIKAMPYLLFHTFLWMIAIVGCFGFYFGYIWPLCVCVCVNCVSTVHVKFENMWPELTSYVCLSAVQWYTLFQRVNLK